MFAFAARVGLIDCAQNIDICNGEDSVPSEAPIFGAYKLGKKNGAPESLFDSRKFPTHEALPLIAKVEPSSCP